MFKFEFRRRIELSGFEPTNIENFSNYFESSIYLIALSIENIYFEFSFFQKKNAQNNENIFRDFR
jgi:hypothetical protein